MKHRRRSLQLVCLCAILGLTVLPTGPAAAIENWTSSRQIRDLCSWNSALWAATGGGVLRVDLRTLVATKWTTTDGLPETDVLQIRPWDRGLVAATRRGVASFDGTRWQRLPPLPVVDAARPPRVAVLNDSLFAASGGRVYRLLPGDSGWSILHLPVPVHIVAEAGTEVWAVGARGLWSSTDGRSWQRVADIPPDPPVALLQVAGHCVMGTRRGVYLRHAQRWHPFLIDALPGATHLADLSARGDTLLLAVHGSGIWELELANAQSHAQHSTYSPSAGALRRHQSGELPTIRCALPVGNTLWVGTTEGLRRWDGKEWQSVRPPGELSGNGCVALARHQGTVWLATQEGGVERFQEGRWEGESGLRPHVLQLASAGPRLWARYPDGSLAYQEAGCWSEFRPGPKDRLAWVSGIWSAGEALWMGAWGGAARWGPGPEGIRQGEWLHGDPLEGQTVTAVTSYRGETWVGTAWRGVAARAADGTWRRYHEGNGLPDSWVTAMAGDGEQLWVGTFNGGLAVWDGTRWSHPAPVPGPGGRKITALAVDARGGLWVGTRRGLARLHSGRWQLWTQDHGLAGDEVQCLLTNVEGVWAGTRTGLSRLRWEEIEGRS